jgi:phosphatidylglycerophosphate synthase
MAGTAAKSSPGSHFSFEFRNVPNLLSLARLLLTGVTWVVALRGDSFLTGIGLLLAFLTDVLDGPIARHYRLSTRFGSLLDSVADQTLIVSALAWLVLLHPEVVTQHPSLWSGAAVLYGADIAVGWSKFRQVAGLHLWSSKVAGLLIFLFMIHAFLAAAYSPLFLYVALGAFMLCCVEDALVFLTRDRVDEHIGTIFRRRG